MTNPSRSASKGRLALSGSSFRRESARMAPKPPMPTFVIPASVPPANITSARPSRIASIASPIAMFEAAHAVHSRRERAARAELHRDPGGAHVRDDRRDRERVDPVGAARRCSVVVAVLEALEPADAGGDRDTGPLGLGRDVEARVLPRPSGPRRGSSARSGPCGAPCGARSTSVGSKSFSSQAK